MKSYRLLAFALVALATVLLLAAAGCKSSKKDSDTDGGGGQTPATEEPADGGDGGETPPSASENGTGGDAGSVSITLSGEVSGDFALTGMSCDHIASTPDEWYHATIVGAVGQDVYTIDAIAYKSSETPPTARLVRNGDNAAWQPREGGATDSDSLTVTDEGGKVGYQLFALESSPAPAESEVQLEGSWTCPGGAYETFEG